MNINLKICWELAKQWRHILWGWLFMQTLFLCYVIPNIPWTSYSIPVGFLLGFLFFFIAEFRLLKEDYLINGDWEKVRRLINQKV